MNPNMITSKKTEDMQKIPKQRLNNNIVHTIVYDFNTEEEPEETQLNMANDMFSPDFETVSQAYSYFAQYCESMHIPKGIVILKIQESLMNLFSADDCDPFILKCALKILDTIGKYTTESFKGQLIISKIWQLLPDPFIFDVISSVICGKKEETNFLFSSDLHPSLLEIFQQNDISSITGALKILKTIIKYSDVPEYTDQLKLLVFNIAKENENQTIVVQCFEIMEEICYSHPEFFISSDISGDLFVRYENFNPIILSAAAHLVSKLVAVFYDQQNDIHNLLSTIEPFPLLSHIFEIEDVLPKKEALSAIFQIISKLPDGAHIIYESGILQYFIQMRENVPHDLWIFALRILCVCCVTLDESEQNSFVESGFIDILIENLDVGNTVIHFDILYALTSLIMLLSQKNKTEDLATIFSNDILYEELESITNESTEENTHMLATTLLNMILEQTEES